VAGGESEQEEESSGVKQLLSLSDNSWPELQLQLWF